VGDILVINKDEIISADCLLLAVPDSDEKSCFIDTCQIDGETNLKPKLTLPVLDRIFSNFKEADFKFSAGPPDPDVFLFSGSAAVSGEKIVEVDSE